MTTAPNKNRPFYRQMYDDLQFKVPETFTKHLMRDPAPPRFNRVQGMSNLTHYWKIEQYIAELEQGFFTRHMQQYYGMVQCIDFNVVSIIGCS